MAKELEIHFVAEDETKNTVKYREHGPIGQLTRIGMLYLKKTAHSQIDNPERLHIILGTSAVEHPAGWLTTKFVAEKPTRNTVRFREDPPIGQDELIGYMYLQKTAYEDLDSEDQLYLAVQGSDTDPFPPGVAKV